ncbi:tetratricopeptide repeat protein [Janibacter sp. G1551]|uniref:tetratricopeptide repeat protein n=1 Tax=Janibacter sp. G1551 TaxID=3420440 RepID=UPI003CFEC1BF
MTSAPATVAPVSVVEVRVLEGPNLYFPRAALKTTVRLPGYLDLETATLRAIAARVGVRRGRPGEPGTEQRQVYLGRVVERAVRLLAAEAGTQRLGVRTRPGRTLDEVVVAYVMRSRGRARVLGQVLETLLTAWLAGDDGAEVLPELATRLRNEDAGEPLRTLRPTVPVASVTGTNGKTTTTRLLAHISMTAGRRTGWSSTDGVVIQGEVVEPGDYSGPGGARAVLSTEGIEVGILETARGGLLLRGMGVSRNDVSVVTNVTADHLGVDGVDTLDQLAEVKAIVTSVTRPDGWAVLNGDDPRVWAMRNRTRAHPWAFSLAPNAPALRESLAVDGRGITVLDGQVAVLHPDGNIDRLVALDDVPATLSGLSKHNVANVLAGAAAALGLGFTREEVIAGLTTFLPDDRLNPGRMNIYTVRLGDAAVTVVVDMAHNEAGLEALLDVSRGLRAPGGRLLLALGTGGDRTDDILESLGEMAGRAADHIVITHKRHYQRGRSYAEFEEHYHRGLARAGVGDVPVAPGEVEALALLAEGAVDGDVIAVMCHEERGAVRDWITAHGGTPDSPAMIRTKVTTARGEHPLDAEFARLATLDPDASLSGAAALLAERPGDPRVLFEVASAMARLGRTTDAIAQHERALAAGLREPHRHRSQIQLASALRSVGEIDRSRALLEALAADRSESAAVIAFLALDDLASDKANRAVGRLLEALLARSTDEDTQTYRADLHRIAADLLID